MEQKTIEKKKVSNVNNDKVDPIQPVDNKAETVVEDPVKPTELDDKPNVPPTTNIRKEPIPLNLDQLLDNHAKPDLFSIPQPRANKVEFLCIKRKRDVDAVPVLVVENPKRGRDSPKANLTKSYELQCTTEGEAFLKGLPDTVKSTISDLVSGKATRLPPSRPPPTSEDVPAAITGKRPRFKVIGKESVPFESSQDSIRLYNVEYDFEDDLTTFREPSSKRRTEQPLNSDLELMREFQQLQLGDEQYVYDIYKVNDNIITTQFLTPYGLLNMNQFGDSDIDLESESDRMSDDYDSNDENHFANDYPDEEDLYEEEDFNYEAYDSMYEDDEPHHTVKSFHFDKSTERYVKDMYDDIYYDLKKTGGIEIDEDENMYSDVEDEYGDEDNSEFYGTGINRVVDDTQGYGLDHDD